MKHKFSLLAISAILFAAFTFVACEKDNNNEEQPIVPATGISLDQHSIYFIQIGDTITLTATITPENATTALTWLSYNSNVAIVENGNVISTGVGETTVRVETAEGEFADSCSVLVYRTSTVNADLPVGKLTFLAYNLGANPNFTLAQTFAYKTTIPTDTTVYGHKYQWGRPADGHQIPTSPLSYTLSPTAPPDHGNFIVNTDFNLFEFDWCENPDSTLWGPVKTQYDPCPVGFRVPTQAEWSSILFVNKWEYNGNGIIISPDTVSAEPVYTMFLPLAGYRVGYPFGPDMSDLGTIRVEEQFGYYRAADSGPKNKSSRMLYVDWGLNRYSEGITTSRVSGIPVRCVAEY